MNWKILGLAVAAGVAFAAPNASAMPMTHQMKSAVSDDVTAVRDGCGRGWRFSHRRGRCVPMGGGYYVDPGAAAAGAAAAVTLGIVGSRHHHRRHHHHRRYHRY